jgi:DNA polymerase-3 subunit beta
MEITVQRAEFVRELQLVQGIVERKNSIPILSNVLLDAEGAELRISATDLDVSLRAGCGATVKKAGAVTLGAKKLHEIVRALPEGDIHLKLLADAHTQIVSSSASFKVAGLPKEDFPTLPEAKAGDVVTLPGQVLLELIERTGFAITGEDARYYLAGALLVLDKDAITMVATDGHRLAYARRAATLELPASQRVLVPRKAINELARLIEDGADAEYAQVENHLVFSVGHRTLACKTIEGQFPAYEKVVKAGGDKTVLLNREAFSMALRRVSLLSSERSRAVRVSVAAGQLSLLASSPDVGEARETLEAEYAGDELEIGFNAQYLLDFLAAAGGERVALQLTDQESSGLLRPESESETEYRYVVMPMRL